MGFDTHILAATRLLNAQPAPSPTHPRLGRAALLPWGGRVDVVLAYLGVTFIFAVPFLFLDSRWLIGAATVIFALSPLIAEWVRSALVHQPILLFSRMSNHPVAYFIEWAFTGRAYHATWLLPFLLLGIVFGRLLLQNQFPALAVLGAGVLILGVTYVFFVGPQNEAGTYVRGGYPELAFDLGRSLAVYGVAVFAFAASWKPLRETAIRICVPLTLAGRVPLTLYVLHVLLLYTIEHSALFTQPPAAAWPLIVLVICLVFASIWGLTLGVGPVERLLGVFSLRHPLRWLFVAQPATSADIGLATSPREYSLF